MDKQLLRLEIVVPEEGYDVVTGLLALMVSFGWEETSLATGETLFRLHAENGALLDEVARAVEARLPDAVCRRDSVVQADWVNAWKDFFTPVACGRRFVVLPPWRAEEPGFEGRSRILIEPKSAFGTGHHATTALCLGVLSGLLDEGRIAAGQTFLDLGTGSGVLGLGLCESGLAGEGCDIDPIAIDNVVENRVLNHVAPAAFPVALGSIELYAGRTFDVVVANILAQPLRDLAAPIAAAVAPGGVLVLSGILVIQADGVEAAYRAQGLPAAGRVVDGEWCALVWR